MAAFRSLFLMVFLSASAFIKAHPLKLSLCEIEYSSKNQLLTITLKLFLTDINEALVFNPYSQELALCQPDEPAKTNRLLLDYLNQFFYVKVNGKPVTLQIKKKNLKGEGDNTALWLRFEYLQPSPLKALEIKNAVFTDLFFDQNNIVYIYVDQQSKSLMLDKKKSVHQLKF